MQSEQIEGLKEIAEEKNLMSAEQKKEVIRLKNLMDDVSLATLFTICEEIFYSIKKDLKRVDKSYEYSWGADLRVEVLKIKRFDGGIGTAITERKISEIVNLHRKDINEFVSLFFEIMELEEE